MKTNNCEWISGIKKHMIGGKKKRKIRVSRKVSIRRLVSFLAIFNFQFVTVVYYTIPIYYYYYY